MGTIMEQIANVDSHGRFSQIYRYLRPEYEKRGMPLTATFELTPHCTLDCKMCYVHRADGKYPHRVLTGDEWIDIMDQAVDLGVLYVSLTGGECMVHPDFWKIYMHLKHRGVYITVLTNATLIDERAIDIFKEYPPHLIQSSVYGTTPEDYERVTGHADAFEKVDRALRLLKETDLITGISLTISKHTQKDFDALWLYAREMTKGRINLDCDLIDAADDSNEAHAVTYGEKKHVWKRHIELSGGTVSMSCEEDFESGLETPENYPDAMPCAAGLSSFSVSSAACMLPCTEFPLGKVDLHTTSVKDAWEHVNDAAKRYTRSDECKTCAFYGKCRFCAARYCRMTGRFDRELGIKLCDKRDLALVALLQKKI